MDNILNNFEFIIKNITYIINIHDYTTVTKYNNNRKML